MTSDDRLEVSQRDVEELIQDQFPEWADLPIRKVKWSGWDNRTFHLGEEMLVRLPSAERYQQQVAKEQKWLPIIAPQLSFQIPKPLALGRPSLIFPWHWSIYRWIDGTSAASLPRELFQRFARTIAEHLKEIHQVRISGGPIPGIHNFYRGGDLKIYNSETMSALNSTSASIDVDNLKKVWEKALSSTWLKEPVCIHGDLSAGNILVKNDKVEAIIDFGNFAVGDPACDLVVAWTNFDEEARAEFKLALAYDIDTWDRARGWALWKSLITLAGINDQKSPAAKEQTRIISFVTSDLQS